MKKSLPILLILLFLGAPSANAAFVEPSMSDYTACPVFTAQSVPPNIMVVLDNSGSMNFNAYGTYPGNGNMVTDEPFVGEPYSDAKSFRIRSGSDDAEENTTSSETRLSHDDLDLGGYDSASNDAVVGLRFQNVEVANKAVIDSAFLEFVANASTAVATNLLIEGEDSDNALPFQDNTDNIKNRPAVAATVNWNGVPAWTSGQTYRVEVTTIVQDIVDRDGWALGNAMVFRISGTGKRDAVAFEENSMRAAVLRVNIKQPDVKRYYGLFNPDYFYSYGNDQFKPLYKKIGYNTSTGAWAVENLSGSSSSLSDSTIVSSRLWDGNFLNWLSMRRIDILRKVLMGGKASERDGDGTQINYGEIPLQTSRVFRKNFDSTPKSPVSPYDGNYNYEMRDGLIYVDVNRDGTYNDVSFHISVEKNANVEPADFLDGNLAGIMQKIGDKARWGNLWFNNGTSVSGGSVENVVGTDVSTLVTRIQAKRCDTYTPLAESFYVAMQYFSQKGTEAGLGYDSEAVPLDDGQGLHEDPYIDNATGDTVYCAKSFVILLTDGASTKDARVPDGLKDYDGDGDQEGCDESDNEDCDYPDGGTDFLDDLALYARTNDLRDDLQDDQNVMLYAIYAFGNEDNARNLLRDAARNGGFNDQDGDNLPDGDYNDPPELRLEWDANADGDPDTYFEANDGYALEARLLQAITDILRQASSGTAASVLSTNSQGAGNSVQAYFRPSVVDGVEEARWLGYLQSLWVDPWGNLREDTNNNLRLDLRNSSETNTASASVDRIIEFYIDEDKKDTRARVYTEHYLYNPAHGDDHFCNSGDCSVSYAPVAMDQTDESLPDKLKPLYEAGQRLAERDPDGSMPRRIFTYIDRNQNQAVDDSGNMFDTSGEVITFDTGMAAELKPYLGVRDNTVWSGLGSSHDLRVTNIISWVRGYDKVGLRNRTLDGVTWRLGDIVHSTPMVVAAPAENHHLLYGNESYSDFLDEYINRETIVYVGGNDGMLHAFTNWVYTTETDPTNPTEKPRPKYSKELVPSAPTEERIGDEIWAYIPQSLLPHLKWTASTDYTHTYFVDSEVRVFDADILPDDTYYNDDDSDPNYGTFLVAGFRLGGKQIQVNEDFGGGLEERTFNPTYTLMDITNPRSPRLVWERSYSDLNMTSSIPAPVRVNGKWFLVFGSGPSEYDGISNHGGYIYVVDLATGDPVGSGAGVDWRFGPFENNAYFNDALAMDIFTSNNVDAIYMANNYFDGNQWQADIYKVTVPCNPCIWDADVPKYNDDPGQWTVSKFFEGDTPITIKPNAARAMRSNELFMLFFGTGRYISEDDKTDTTQQYLYGLKDPFYFEKKYDGQNGDYYHDFGRTLTLDRSMLHASDNVRVTTDGTVLGSSYGTDFGTFTEAVRREEDGWYLSLLTNGNEPSERIITRTSVVGGIALTPAYTPNQSVCEMGGDTALIGVYFETGTGYTQQIFDIAAANLTYAAVTQSDGTTKNEEVVAIRDDDLLKGTPAPRVPLHAGLEGGATALIQQGTGALQSVGVSTAEYFKSIITEWWNYE